jgi:F-box/leucine-rich repeat protein 14
LNWPVEGITDTSVQCLSLLTNLKYLNLSWCEQISDKGVMSLSTLTALQVLKLSHCANVTNRTLDFITRSFHSLRVLYLQNTAVNDEGVRDYLPRLSQLTAISLGGKSLTDNALLYLPLLRNVKRVVIGGPNFTSNAVLNLLKSVGAELEYLKIWQTDITDDVIEQIALARQLTKLNLDGCELITDRGISYLTGHKTLTYLSLFGCTQVTDRGPRAISHDKLKVVR